MTGRSAVGAAAGTIAFLAAPAIWAQGPASAPAAAGAAAHQARITLQNYCAGCHSPGRQTAGMVIDPASVADVAADAERWEKVLVKLRAGTMPPPGRSRPDTGTYDAIAAFLESELDRAAATHPNVGKLPPLHRLTRTEYQNVIRDLLALGALPREMDYSYLLPEDNTGSGFDNIAELLFISPPTMERYLNAAEKISAMAVGDMAAPLMVNTYRVPDEHPQGERVDLLPVGTRGGLAILSHFPLDAEYEIEVSFVGRSTETQQLEISVDGERVALHAAVASVGGRGARGGQFGRGGGRGAAGRAGGAGVPAGVGPGGDRGAGSGPAGAGPGDDRTPQFRVPLAAGPHLVGVTFIERHAVRDEDVLRPRLRGTGPELGVETVTISGPFSPTGRGDTPSRRRLFVCRPETAAEEVPCARQILSTLARRAYRRPVTAEDVDRLMPFYAAGRAEGDFDLGIQRALQRLLVSPQFLFRIEAEPATAPPGTPFAVSDLELASRLSFFIWSSIPDDELLEVAIAGTLRQPGQLEQQVRRMLADSRSGALVTNFAAQWLYLRDLLVKKPNEILFPDFDETLREAMMRESTLFIDSVLRGGGSVLELLSADYTFLNERLAKHYGIPNVEGSDFRRVTLPAGSPRGGLLGQGSLLTITSYANRTSPVNRGKWVLENLLSSPPPPPPPDVPALKVDSAASGGLLTMRDAMVQHRENPACASCHSRMDPIGFAMENFDAVGRWRDRDNGLPIDTSGVFPTGVRFDGMAGLKQALVDEPEEFVSTFTSKLLMYGLGRNVQYFDQPVVRAIVRGAKPANYTFESIVLGVVRSAPFQMRQAYEPQAQAPPSTESQER
jgi:mono/diheme cytochrome c family protein